MLACLVLIMIFGFIIVRSLMRVPQQGRSLFATRGLWFDLSLWLSSADQYGRLAQSLAGERHDLAICLLWRIVFARNGDHSWYVARAHAQSRGQRSLHGGCAKVTAPIVITAGGTGGHLFPAQALAEELTRRRRKTILITDERGMKWQDAFPSTVLHMTQSGTTTRSGNRGAYSWRLKTRHWNAAGCPPADAVPTGCGDWLWWLPEFADHVRSDCARLSDMFA